MHGGPEKGTNNLFVIFFKKNRVYFKIRSYLLIINLILPIPDHNLKKKHLFLGILDSRKTSYLWWYFSDFQQWVVVFLPNLRTGGGTTMHVPQFRGPRNVAKIVLLL